MTSSPVYIAPSPVLVMGRALRIFLLTVAILALAAAAFVIGRVSVGSGSVPTRAPVVSTHVPTPTRAGMVSTQLPTENDADTCHQVVHNGSVAC